jgi:benzoyl-CoA reductase/2-hydroxyglutaryl-CoA dehydratase subunit BcrC/BadD/HgdB
MNVPSTWQVDAAGQLYRDELERLGRCLVQWGGTAPSEPELARVMIRYDRGRRALRDARGQLSGRELAQALLQIREDGRAVEANFGCRPVGRTPRPRGAAVPLALVGGPLLPQDYTIFDWIERAGGRVVLDATETGERTLPDSFDRKRLGQDPLGELARAYFDSIPDVFRRPNFGFYRWIEQETAARQVRGIVLRRYVWCDLWHAEVARMKQCRSVPVLELDVADDAASQSRSEGRIEAFLEMLT